MEVRDVKDALLAITENRVLRSGGLKGSLQQLMAPATIRGQARVRGLPWSGCPSKSASRS